MLEIRHLETLAAIRDGGSLQEAAERLHLTQSALSHQLRDLETRLGTPLLNR
ncbi:LysR family transcriptional regulator, partial [Bordetella pertussis]